MFTQWSISDFTHQLDVAQRLLTGLAYGVPPEQFTHLNDQNSAIAHVQNVWNWISQSQSPSEAYHGLHDFITSGLNENKFSTGQREGYELVLRYLEGTSCECATQELAQAS